MVDIVYPLGDGAAAIGDRPLRFSLRSREKFAAATTGRVLVAGCIPAWLSGKAVAVPTPVTVQKGLGIFWRTMYAVRDAIAACGIDKPFLVSSDDHYLTRPADMDKWPYYCRPNVIPSPAEYAASHDSPPELWMHSVLATAAALRKAGLPARFRSGHLDMWIDPRDFAEALDFAEAHRKECSAGFQFRILTNAFCERRLAAEGKVPKMTIWRFDSKVANSIQCMRRAQSPAIPAITSSPKGERNPDFWQWMEGYYPVPSRWEKHEQGNKQGTGKERDGKWQ